MINPGFIILIAWRIAKSAADDGAGQLDEWTFVGTLTHRKLNQFIGMIAICAMRRILVPFPVAFTVFSTGAKGVSHMAGTGAYVILPNQVASGTFNSRIPVTDMPSFEQQALYQHTTAC